MLLSRTLAAGLLLSASPAAAGPQGPPPATRQVLLASYKVSGEGSVATALALRDGHRRVWLATSRHVLEKMKGESFRLVDRRLQPDGTYVRHERTLPLRRDGKPLWTASGDHDLAVLPVDRPDDLAALPVDCLADEESLRAAGVDAGSAVRAACFPARFEANGAGLPIIRGGVIASFPLLPVARHPRILVDMTTFEGDSGGPVWLAGTPAGRPLVIGLISRRHFSEARVEGEPDKRPFQLAEAVPAAFLPALIAAAAAD